MTAQPALDPRTPDAGRIDPDRTDPGQTDLGPGPHRLASPVRDYPWGSPSVIPELLGRPGDGSPVAELWMGAHPADPSVLSDDPDGRDLGALIASDPDRWLGQAVSRRFGRSLPFLLKVLAAEKNLSLQAHPSLEQARAGFARDNEAGLAADHPDRNYRDANHKPEQIVALSPFTGLCGFRPTRQTAAFLDALDVPTLAGYRQRLMADGGLRDVVTALLTLPATSITALLTDLVPACRRLAATGHTADATSEQTDDTATEHTAGAVPASPWAAEAGWIVRLAEQNPGDRGVVIALLLNLVRLQPGESMFLGAGQIHTYLRGTGVEILANSDNVLRGGLTGKHVDVPELMRVLDMSEHTIVPVTAEPTAAGVFAYPSSVPDFRLWRIEAGPEPIVLPGPGPRVVVCTAGSARLDTEPTGSTGGTGLRLTRGEAVFFPPGADVTVTGSTDVTVTGSAVTGSAGTGTDSSGAGVAGASTVFVAGANV